MDQDRQKQIALQAAKVLLDTKSVLFNAAEPFILTSGRVSPVYIDCRRPISFVKERQTLMSLAAEILKNSIGDTEIDYIAGGETGGIAYAAFLADRLEKPMLYIRKKPKGFGRMAQIEGFLPESGRRNTVLVEDLQTDGGSKKIFIDALRTAGADISHAFVVFHYGIYPKSEENMKAAGVTLHALTTWQAVLEVARAEKYFDYGTLEEVESFLQNPERWLPRKTGNITTADRVNP